MFDARMFPYLPGKSLTAGPASDRIEIVKREKDFTESKNVRIETGVQFVLS